MGFIPFTRETHLLFQKDAYAHDTEKFASREPEALRTSKQFSSHWRRKLIWVWLKIKREVVRRFWSMFY